MKIALYSNHSNQNADLAQITASNKWDYSRLHNYTLITDRMPWGKHVEALERLLDILSIHDAVLTIGSDVIFTNLLIPVEKIIQDHDHVVLARETLGPSDPANRHLGWSSINNDVTLWQKTGATRHLIEQLIATAHTWTPLKCLWQEWLMYQLDDPASHASKTIRTVHPRLMNSTIQSGESEWKPGDWILHLVGFSNPDKVKLAKQILNSQQT